MLGLCIDPIHTCYHGHSINNYSMITEMAKEGAWLTHARQVTLPTWFLNASFLTVALQWTL